MLRVPWLCGFALVSLVGCGGTSPHMSMIAHGGASLHWPENTLTAISAAFDDGATAVEVDVRLSRDGVAVLMHDDTVDRTTNGQGAVTALTIQQLHQLDAGDWKCAHCGGVRVPALWEALITASGRGPLYLDAKVGGLSAAVASDLQRLRLPPTSVILSVSSMADLEDAARDLPGTPLVWLGGGPDAVRDLSGLEHLRTLGVQGFEVKWGSGSPAFQSWVQRHGFFYWTYTINDPVEMDRAIRAGVDGIETDDVAALLARQ